MENILVYFGLLSCLWIGILGQATVSVSKNLAVLPTPNPLINPDDRVDVVLNCTGSRSELSYYIENRVMWSFIDKDNRIINLTKSFYPEEAVEDLFTVTSKNYHYSIEHGAVGEAYGFSLGIHRVTHADNGVYNCSLVNANDKMIDSKVVTLTVLHPVDRLSIEIMNDKKETIVQKRTAILENETPEELTPGVYFVKCDASGSNPAPNMSLFFNEKRPTVSVSKSMDASGGRVKNKGSFTKRLQLSAHTNMQAVVCSANIPGDHFPEKEAGISIMVQVDKPDIACSNDTTRLGERYAKIICNVSAEGASNAGLLCEKISWLLGNENVRIAEEERWKDPSKKLDILESSCKPGVNGLTVILTIFDVKPSHFVEMYYIVYGLGDNSHRIPIQLHEDTTAGVAMVTASLSTILCLVMATVAKHLVL